MSGSIHGFRFALLFSLLLSQTSSSYLNIAPQTVASYRQFVWEDSLAWTAQVAKFISRVGLLRRNALPVLPVFFEDWIRGDENALDQKSNGTNGQTVFSTMITRSKF